MSTSTDGILAYGYHLGAEGDGLDIQETDEYGALTLDWYDEDDDAGFTEQAMARLLAAKGFTETDWRAPGYYERQRAAEKALGLEFVEHCSQEYPMWILAAKYVRASRGYPETLDLAELAAEADRENYDARLAEALEVLGITPKQTKPAWLLASNWS